jgi:hypothetical protein
MGNANLRLAMIVTAAVTAVITALSIGGILTPRGFGVAGLVAMVVCGLAFYVFAIRPLSRQSANVVQRKSTRMSGKGLFFRVAALPIWLAFATWATRGGPWIGASMMVLFFIGYTRA